jgi:hypothetical protein
MAEQNRAYARWLTDTTAPTPRHWPEWLARGAYGRSLPGGDRHDRAAQATDAAVQLEAAADAYEAACRLPLSGRLVFWDAVGRVGPVAAFVIAVAAE